MEKRIDGGDGAGVVEAAGFLVRDGEGRKRALLGCWPAGVGLAIYDENGSERASLLLGELGPALAFALHGDVALMLGVDDPGGAVSDHGPYMVLLGRDGRPVWALRAAAQGLVREP